MRLLLMAAGLGLAMVAVNTSTSAAADNAGNVPATLLASLGVGGMQHLSDAQGMEIRGKGTRGLCIPSCRPVCQPSCQPKSCERPPCEIIKQICVPICRPTCGNSRPT